MSQTLTFDLAQKSLDVLLERAGQPRNGSPSDTQELLDNCEIPYLIIDRLWRSVQEALDRGVEQQKFMALLKDCLNAIEHAARTMAAVRERVQAETFSPQDKVVGLSLLDRLEGEAAKKRDELTALRRWLETPRPDIDLSKLRLPAAAREVEGYVSLDELKHLWFLDKDV